MENNEMKDENSYECNLSKKELLEYLHETIKHSENLPIRARHSYVTQADLESALILIYALFTSKD